MTPKYLKIVLSTLFSITLWIFVSFSYEYTNTIRVPIKFTDIREGNAILSQSTNEINLTLKGQGWILAQISSGSDVFFQISTDEKFGVQRKDVREAISENSWINPSVQVAMISPAFVDYKIERIKYKNVPIVSDAAISIEKGYNLVSEIILNPDSLKISGPQSLVNSIQNISTEAEIFENIDENISTQIALKPLRYIQYENQFTNIEFKVQKIVDKTFNNVPVKVENVPNLRTLELFPPNVDITLRGGLENVGKMSVDSVSISVDFNDAFLDSLGVLYPKITIPNFTVLTNVNPKTLKYIIKQN
ncbi:MAG: YbbR-like domain-containing protein [Bacteroidetes bacterium]|nr:YbbR-like domain-containing protein [Bacteroidota bacterium]MBU1117191.1 YbbR-like domain-containing protein [Bacteroidota bacterium]MBU1797890.1 YbbR-like domain-containing protein [Bacteroidota bacterium]